MQDNKKISPFINFELEEGEELKLITPIKGISDNVKENTYGITSKGRIFSTARLSDSATTAKELSLNYSMDGYTRVWLSSNTLNESKEYIVSRLVLAYFGGPIPDDPSKYDANHKDYKRDNNNIENLEWLTHEENIKYSYVNTDHVTDEQVLDIYNRVVVNNEDPEIVAKDYNISRRTIMDAAHGIGNFEKIHKRLGLEYDKKHILTPEEIKEIYRKLLNNIPISKLAKEYKVCEPVIKRIKYKNGRYADYLTEFEDMEYNTNRKISEEEAINIHNDIISEKYTLLELHQKYKLTNVTILDIKFCRNAYSFLQTKYGINPPRKENNCNRTSTDTALLVCKLAQRMSSKQIKELTGLSIDAINDIKFCRDGFEYLMYDYGIKPVPSATPWKNNKFKNRVAINPKV